MLVLLLQVVELALESSPTLGVQRQQLKLELPSPLVWKLLFFHPFSHAAWALEFWISEPSAAVCSHSWWQGSRW